MSNVKCGTVTSDGEITSNSNFSCPQQSKTGQYFVDYNGYVTNPVPVITLTSQDPGLTYVLNPSSTGFWVFVYNADLAPSASGFNFIVGEII